MSAEDAGSILGTTSPEVRKCRKRVRWAYRSDPQAVMLMKCATKLLLRIKQIGREEEVFFGDGTEVQAIVISLIDGITLSLVRVESQFRDFW